MKKRIRQSNLLLRFYSCDGWSSDELNTCAIKGKCSLHPKSSDNPYFIFDVGNVYDSLKIAEIGYIDRNQLNLFPERKLMSDLEIIEFMNWQH